MSSHTFGAFIDIESSSSSGHPESHVILIAPQKAVPKTYHSVPQPDAIELDNFEELNGPPKSGRATPVSGSQTPKTPSALEMSRPSTPPGNTEDHGGEEVDVIQSFSNPPMNRFRMAALCLINFGNGLSDSAPGALIPYIQKHYGLSYTIVALIFVTQAAGFISAAFFVDAVRARLGRGKTFMVSQTLMTVAYILIVCTPPWPVVIAAFFPLGFGYAFNLSISNVFAANLQNATKMLGSVHGSYGLGGTVGPLIATAMVTKGNLVWSRYYLLTLGVTVFSIFFAGWSFWHYEAENGQPLLTTVERTASRAQTSTTTPEIPKPSIQLKTMLQAFKIKTVILGALFIFAYQGAEVSISGWVISFLIDARHGVPGNVGYVTSGFWGGITIGRFLLSHPAHKIGEKLFVYGLIIGAAAFQLLVWLVPNVITDAVAVAIVGVLLGPVYPCATVIFSRAIPKKDQISGLSVISAFGSSGGAVAPFTTGILAQAVGTFVLHPIAIGLFAAMMVCWFALPNVRKRTE